MLKRRLKARQLLREYAEFTSLEAESRRKGFAIRPIFRNFAVRLNKSTMPKKLTKKEYKNRRRAKLKIARRKRSKSFSMENTLLEKNRKLLDRLEADAS